jgi:hypothetical protein
MGDWKPDMSVTLDVPEKKIGLKKSSTLLLWLVPARVAGSWRMRIPLPLPIGATDVEVDIEQKFQELAGSVRRSGKLLPLERGFVHGELVFFRFGDGADTLLFKGRATADRMVGRITDAEGREYPWRALRTGAAATGGPAAK